MNPLKRALGGRLIQVCLVLMSFSAQARADVWPMQTINEDHRSFLVFSGDYTSFSLPTGSLAGYGAKFDFNHFFADKVSVDTYFSTAFGADGGTQSSFTGFGGYVNYLVMGHCCEAKKTIVVGYAPVISESRELGNLLQVGVGFDQFFLNGSQAVYPASGLGVGISYDFQAFSQRFRAAARTSTMTANKVKVQATFLSFGVAFPL